MSDDGDAIATAKTCKEKLCRFYWAGFCTNETFDSENPIPCWDTDNA